jgi:dTDP-4-dehydrorhamnose 3,5-epimerase-like enzyme
MENLRGTEHWEHSSRWKVQQKISLTSLGTINGNHSHEDQQKDTSPDGKMMSGMT